MADWEVMLHIPESAVKRSNAGRNADESDRRKIEQLF